MLRMLNSVSSPPPDVLSGLQEVEGVASAHALGLQAQCQTERLSCPPRGLKQLRTSDW